jgi:hypothetical protein
MQAETGDNTGDERFDPLLAAGQAENLHQSRGHAVDGPMTGEQGLRRIACQGVR